MTAHALWTWTSLLLVIAWVLKPPADDPAGMLNALRQSLFELMVTAAVAAGLAGVLLWAWPRFDPQRLDSQTLATVNRSVAEALAWLQRAWLVPLTLALAGLALAFVGLPLLRGWGQVLLGQSIAWGLRVKAVAALCAAMSLSLAGWQANAQAVVAQGRDMQAKWPALRITLAEQASRAAAQALADGLADVLPASQAWPALSAAHAQVAHLVPSRRSANPLLRQAAMRPVAPLVERAMPDLPYHRLDPDRGAPVAAAAPLPDKTLMRQVMNAVTDETAAVPAREALLSFGHPLIDELLGALADPVVTQPLRDQLVNLALRHIEGLDAAALRGRAVAFWKQPPGAASRRMALALKRAALGLQANGSAAKHAVSALADTPALRQQLLRAGVPETQIEPALDTLLERAGALATLVKSPEVASAVMATAAGALMAGVVRDAKRDDAWEKRKTPDAQRPTTPAHLPPHRARPRGR